MLSIEKNMVRIRRYLSIRGRGYTEKWEQAGRIAPDLGQNQEYGQWGKIGAKARWGFRTSHPRPRLARNS